MIKLDDEEQKPNRSDYVITEKDLKKSGKPTEVYEFCERMRRWREASFNSVKVWSYRDGKNRHSNI